jgi:hypothetical protein
VFAGQEAQTAGFVLQPGPFPAQRRHIGPAAVTRLRLAHGQAAQRLALLLQQVMFSLEVIVATLELRGDVLVERLVGFAGAAQQSKVVPGSAHCCLIEIGRREVAAIMPVDHQHGSVWAAVMPLGERCTPQQLLLAAGTLARLRPKLLRQGRR